MAPVWRDFWGLWSGGYGERSAAAPECAHRSRRFCQAILGARAVQLLQNSQNIQRANNFDFLRFLGAIFVVWGHSYALGAPPAPSFWGRGIHEFGVVVFFCISGYLVSQSLVRTSTVSSFLLKRCLRIFPALAACVLISVFVLGPAVSTLDLQSYFLHPQTRRYLWNIVLSTQYFLPGVFDTNGKPGAVNGSLWSLPVEFVCYLALAALCLMISRRRLIYGTAVLLLLTSATGLYLIQDPHSPLLYRTAFGLFPFFFAAGCLSLLGERVRYRLDVAIALIALLYLVSAANIVWLREVALWLAVPYIVVAFGNRASQSISDWGHRWHGDISYGIYLYSFPIQQLIIHTPSTRPHVVTIIVGTLAGSIACGVASWHLIEKRALALKNRKSLPMRGAFTTLRRKALKPA